MLHYLIRYLRKTCTEHEHTTDTQNGKKKKRERTLLSLLLQDCIFRSKFVLQFKIIKNKKEEIKKKVQYWRKEKKVTKIIFTVNVALRD